MIERVVCIVFWSTMTCFVSRNHKPNIWKEQNGTRITKAAAYNILEKRIPNGRAGISHGQTSKALRMRAFFGRQSEFRRTFEGLKITPARGTPTHYFATNGQCFETSHNFSEQPREENGDRPQSMAFPEQTHWTILRHDFYFATNEHYLAKTPHLFETNWTFKRFIHIHSFWFCVFVKKP